MLEHQIEQTMASAPTDFSFWQDSQLSAPPPYSCHRLLTWMLEHEYVLTNIADCAAAGPDGYFLTELFKLSSLSGHDCETALTALD